jgi:1,4-dihydroxy-2-naphthoate octaprenyltransferase
MVRGALQLARPVPLITWSLTTVVLGLAAAGHWETGWPVAVAAVLGGGVLLQGYVTHALNDLYDWASGTDQMTPGRLSGGSHVVGDGLLDLGSLRWLAIVGAGLYLTMLVWVGAWRGPTIWGLGAAALMASVAYSLPPFRLSYRPLWGEWAGIFPPLAAGVLATGWAVAGRVGPVLAVTAFIQGILCVASVMEHHLVDIDSDWAAHPQKRTSPAYWQRVRGRPGSQVASAYDAGAALISMAAALALGPRFWWSAFIALLSAAIAWTTRGGDVRDETRRDWALKTLAVVHAAGYAVLAWAGVG